MLLIGQYCFLILLWFVWFPLCLHFCQSGFNSLLLRIFLWSFIRLNMILNGYLWLTFIMHDQGIGWMMSNHLWEAFRRLRGRFWHLIMIYHLLSRRSLMETLWLLYIMINHLLFRCGLMEALWLFSIMIDHLLSRGGLVLALWLLHILMSDHLFGRSLAQRCWIFLMRRSTLLCWRSWFLR